jgi:hypothetical protein
MIDSGSTLFINPFIVNCLAIPTSAHLLLVTTTSGVKMATDHICSQLVFQ